MGFSIQLKLYLPIHQKLGLCLCKSISLFLKSYLFHFILYAQCWINAIDSPTSEAIQLPPIYCSSCKNNPTPLLALYPPSKKIAIFSCKFIIKPVISSEDRRALNIRKNLLRNTSGEAAAQTPPARVK